MSIDRRLRHHRAAMPAIYDVIPRGPLSASRRSRSTLSRSRPTSWVPLSPPSSSMPPGSPIASGRSGPAFEDLDDWCPTGPKRPKLPPWWPPIPGSRATPGLVHRLPPRVRRSTRCGLGRL